MMGSSATEYVSSIVRNPRRSARRSCRQPRAPVAPRRQRSLCSSRVLGESLFDCVCVPSASDSLFVMARTLSVRMPRFSCPFLVSPLLR
jgi:hypothetical protein